SNDCRKRKLFSGVTLPLCLRSGSNHSRRFGCMFTNRRCAVLALLALTSMSPLSKSISLQSSRSNSVRPTPGNRATARYRSTSRVAASSSCADSLTVRIPGKVERQHDELRVMIPSERPDGQRPQSVVDFFAADRGDYPAVELLDEQARA